jgi:hypothetical protein
MLAVARSSCSRLQSAQNHKECGSMVVSEGMELIIVLLVILANLGVLVGIQKWSGLT